jgi:hypothetical protein
MSYQRCSHPILRSGRGLVAPTILRSDENARIASAALTPRNPALGCKWW